MSYNAILEAARNQDEVALASALTHPERISIDIRSGGPYRLTPAALLAKENNIEAVEFLRKHHASDCEIVYGFALGNHTEQVELYKEYGDYIVTGYVLNGRVEEAKQYRAEDDTATNNIAHAHAMAGNVAQVEMLRISGASVDSIARGYALVGNIEQVEIYRTKHNASVNHIAFMFALAGNLEQVEIYRDEHGASVDDIAQGFAMAGNLAMVQVYLTEHHASLDAVARGFAKGGYIGQVERCIRLGASVEAVLAGFEQEGHVVDFECYELLAGILEKIPRTNYPERALAEYAMDCLLNPIKILDGYPYSDEHKCAIMLAPSIMPVRLSDGAVLDLDVLLKCNFKHPLLQGETFEVRDIHPARDIRNALARIAGEPCKIDNDEAIVPVATSQCFTPKYDDESDDNDDNEIQMKRIRLG